MNSFPRIHTLALTELLDRVSGWSTMPPAQAIAAVGKAEASDLFYQLFAAIAEETTPQT